jgi:lipopolysaccharide/colanic/teichoic acid biosynthesis glycosyltransferase
MYMRWGKRALDIVASVGGLIITMPLMVLVAALIVLGEGLPLHFRQVRAGFRGRPFVFLKFRTMNNDRDSAGELLPDEQRLTALGRFLRSTSLDELPELWNVLKGDMSLVGPRPLLTEYLDRYTPEQARRHDIKPGITGLAQISGRNALHWEERFALDVWYVENCSLWLDLSILARTPPAVLRRRGITAQGSATMPPFQGGESHGRR